MKKCVLGLFLILVFLAGVPSLLWAQLDIQYQSRSQEQLGSWKEGVKPKPVSGLNVELISVLADYQEPVSSETFPNAVKLQFYLDDEHAVYLTVRELDYRTYYWLDKVEPARVWEKGFQNVFAWPTDPVLQQLTPKLGLYELGALVRLDAESTSSIERVAPAVLYHKDAPSKIEGYFFTLKTGEDARVMASITQKPPARKLRRKSSGENVPGFPLRFIGTPKTQSQAPTNWTSAGFLFPPINPFPKRFISIISQS